MRNGKRGRYPLEFKLEAVRLGQSDVLEMGLFQPCPKRGEMIFHSDRGSQYASDDFRVVLYQYGIMASMSRKDLILTQSHGVLIGVTLPPPPLILLATVINSISF